MKLKLNHKILLSYIILLVVAFVIATGIATTIVENRLKRKAAEDLRSQAEAIINQISTSKMAIDAPKRLIQFMRNTRNTGLVMSDVVLLSPDKKVIYRSDLEMDESLLRSILTKEHPNYIRHISEVRSEDNILGYVLLISDVAHINQSVQVLRSGLVMGMLVALVIGVVVSVFLGHSITKPIKILGEEMVAVTNDATHKIVIPSSNDEIEKLYKAFDTMHTTINTHMDERKRFFQNASHELKTPLMSIQGYAEAIKDGIVEGDEVDESLDVIINKSQQLKKTVEEIIYLSKLMNQDFTYDLKEVDMVELLTKCKVEQEILGDEKGIRLVLEVPTHSVNMQLDESKFTSVIENLVSNGIRYANSLIKIVLIEQSSGVTIRVMDDGKGLGEGEEDKVFERFYKGEKGNTGIGLAIVAEIVKSHGGQIRAGNHISGGAVFEITLMKSV